MRYQLLIHQCPSTPSTSQPSPIPLSFEWWPKEWGYTSKQLKWSQFKGFYSCVYHLCISCCFPPLVGGVRITQLIAEVGDLCGCEAINGCKQNETKVLKLRDETLVERDTRVKLQTHTETVSNAHIHKAEQKHRCVQQLLTCGWLPADQTPTESPSWLWRKSSVFQGLPQMLLPFSCVFNEYVQKYAILKMCALNLFAILVGKPTSTGQISWQLPVPQKKNPLGTGHR